MTVMDYEPDFGSVGPCGDLGNGPSSLRLPECGFSGEEEALLPWLWDAVMLVIYLQVVRQVDREDSRSCVISHVAGNRK